MKNECDIIKDLLFSYNDGVLSETSKDFVEKHLKTCKDCNNVFKEIKHETEEKNEKEEIDIFKSVKKKITKNNTLMAFVTLDDLYGSFETIVFESVYNKYQTYLEEDKIILIEGRLSIREDEDPKIIAQSIKEIINSDEEDENVINIDISEFTEKQKEDLRTLIRFYSKMNNKNCNINVIVNGEIRPCGKILLNKDNIEKFQNISEKNIVYLKNNL